MSRYYFIAVLLVAGSPTNSATIHVPSGQPTIQAGIDAAVNGDTILVADGTYTGDGNRDIDFGGKSVVLKSANGPAFTVIDCEGTIDEPHRGFFFHSQEDTTTVVDGITIQNGFGARYGGIFYAGGAILCDSANPLISRCIIVENLGQYGGGILCLWSNPIIRNCTIARNSGWGSAAFLAQSSPNFESCIIAENGFQCHRSEPSFDCCVYDGTWDSCLAGQGDINGNFSADPRFCKNSYFLQDSSPCLPENNDCGQLIGALGAGCEDCDYIKIDCPRDTLRFAFIKNDWVTIPVSVLNARKVTVTPMVALHRDDTIHVKLSEPDTITMNVVATSSCDTLSCQFVVIARGPMTLHVPQDFPTIQAAIDIAYERDTILVDDGVYTGAGNTNISLRGKRLLVTTRSGPDKTTIDCEYNIRRRGFYLSDEDSLSVIQGFTIRNGHRSGIALRRSNLTLRNLVLDGNVASNGGGIYCLEAAPLIENCRFIANAAQWQGGGIYCKASSPVIVNSLFDGNSAYEGGALACEEASSLTLENCTLVRNQANYGSGISYRSSFVLSSSCVIAFGLGRGSAIFGWRRSVIPQATFDCTNIFGNSGGDWRSGTDHHQYGNNGNISVDPLFCDIDNDDFQLQPESPGLPENNECNEIIGAFGSGCLTVGVENSFTSLLPEEFSISQNYPNPFNPATVIQFSLPEAASVRIDIFNLLGRRVTSLIDERLSAGFHTINWDGSDRFGRSLASGVYFYRIEAGAYVDSKKMILLK